MERGDRPVDPAVLTPARAYPPGVLARIAALCEGDPDHESCGFVVERGGGLEVVAIPNAADRYHDADRREHPRTRRDAYVMEPRAQLRVLREVEAHGGRVAAIWHSHVDGDAAFSAQDRADALVDGLPLFPGVEYIVAAMRSGHVVEIRRHRWTGAAFAGERLA